MVFPKFLFFALTGVRRRISRSLESPTGSESPKMGVCHLIWYSVIAYVVWKAAASCYRTLLFANLWYRRYQRVRNMIRIKSAGKDVADEEKKSARKQVMGAVFSFACAVALIRATPYVLTKL